VTALLAGRAARRAPVIAAVVAGVLLPHPAPAATPDEPIQVIRRAADRVVDVLQDPRLRAPARAGERRDALRRAVEPAFDFDAMARHALGRHWRGRTDAERRHFTTLFRRLVERAYFRKLEGYDGERVVYRGASTDRAYATVRTEIATRRGTDVPVDYELARHDGRWRVEDVLIEGVSLVENYREQFDTIVDESSYRTLVARMEAKVGAEARG
jgi:phospholipid transport system substrate-binding protein